MPHLHVFPYSARAGTPAARMPQLDRALVKERAGRLRATGHALYQAHLDSMIGTQQWLLVENNGLAHTENFTTVAVPSLAAGAMVEVTIAGHDGKHLAYSGRQSDPNGQHFAGDDRPNIGT